jgi:predicted nucleic acid-binding protein
MPGIRVYLDTSVPSHLLADDTPDKMRDTIALWNCFKKGKYNAVLSDVTIAELDRCPEPKRSKLREYLREIYYEEVRVDDTVRLIGRKFVDNGILTDKSIDDCNHLAVAMVSGCHIVASWNFKHIVKHRTIQAAQWIALQSNCADIKIYAPTSLLEEDDYDP